VARRKIFLSALWVALAPVGWGSVIYSSGVPVLPPRGPEITASQVVAGFALTSPSIIDGLNFWSIDMDPPFTGFSGTVAWSIFADAGGAPGAEAFSGQSSGFDRTTDGHAYPVIPGTAHIYKNYLDLPHLSLGAGNYWLGLVNGPAPSKNFAGFLWAESSTPVPAQLLSQTLVSSQWDNSGLSLAFELTGVQVPEPASLALTGIALVALLTLTRRRSVS
jgi:hypothetical protein